MPTGFVRLVQLVEELAAQSGAPEMFVLQTLRDYDLAGRLPERMLLSHQAGQWLTGGALANIVAGLRSGYDVVREDRATALADVDVSVEAARDFLSANDVRKPSCLADRRWFRRGKYLSLPELPREVVYGPPPPPPPLDSPADVYDVEAAISWLEKMIEEWSEPCVKGVPEGWEQRGRRWQIMRDGATSSLEVLRDEANLTRLRGRLAELDRWFEEAPRTEPAARPDGGEDAPVEAETGTGDAPAFAQEEEGEPAVFRRTKRHWEVRFRGKGTPLDDSVGVRHIARLLANPGRPLHAIDMRIADAMWAGRVDAASEGYSPGDAGEAGYKISRTPAGSGGAASDALSVRNYYGRLGEIDEKLAAARSGRPDRMLELREERDFILRHIGSVVDLHGRPRPGNEDVERARDTVRRAIERAIEKQVQPVLPELALHLDRHLRGGASLVYAPDPPVDWSTS